MFKTNFCFQFRDIMRLEVVNMLQRGHIIPDKHMFIISFLSDIILTVSLEKQMLKSILR